MGRNSGPWGSRIFTVCGTDNGWKVWDLVIVERKSSVKHLIATGNIDVAKFGYVNWFGVKIHLMMYILKTCLIV